MQQYLDLATGTPGLEQINRGKNVLSESFQRMTDKNYDGAYIHNEMSNMESEIQKSYSKTVEDTVESIQNEIATFQEDYNKHFKPTADNIAAASIRYESMTDEELDNEVTRLTTGRGDIFRPEEIDSMMKTVKNRWGDQKLQRIKSILGNYREPWKKMVEPWKLEYIEKAASRNGDVVLVVKRENDTHVTTMPFKKVLGGRK